MQTPAQAKDDELIRLCIAIYMTATSLPVYIALPREHWAWIIPIVIYLLTFCVQAYAAYLHGRLTQRDLRMYYVIVDTGNELGVMVLAFSVCSALGSAVHVFYMLNS